MDCEKDAWCERVSEISVRIVLGVWLVLLLPWLLVSLVAVIAFDGGNTIAANFFVLSVWSYGPAVFGAFKLLDRSRKFVLLPFVSIAGVFISNSLSIPSR